MESCALSDMGVDGPDSLQVHGNTCVHWPTECIEHALPGDEHNAAGANRLQPKFVLAQLPSNQQPPET